MDEETLQQIELFVRSCKGERDEKGNLVEGPEWDFDQIVGALGQVTQAYKRAVRLLEANRGR